MKNKVIVGVLLGLFLNALILFLEPFDTNEYQADYRILLLSGFGLIFSLSFIGYSLLESLYYRKQGQIWRVGNEIISLILFMLLAGSVVFLYNHLVINHESYSFHAHWLYLTRIVAAMMPIIVPFLWFLRQKFGELNIPIPLDSIVLTGLNKGESLTLRRNDLLCIKAVENYVEISFLSTGKERSNTFRQTLSEIHEQAPFMIKCHRSYLVNPEQIKTIVGNSQKAEIAFKVSDKNIPLSKTYYKNLKGQFE